MICDLAFIRCGLEQGTFPSGFVERSPSPRPSPQERENKFAVTYEFAHASPIVRIQAKSEAAGTVKATNRLPGRAIAAPSPGGEGRGEGVRETISLFTPEIFTVTRSPKTSENAIHKF